MKTMLLYLVYDKDQKTLSTPLLAPTLQIAQDSLNTINPENLNSLIIYPLATLNSPLDLFLLTVDCDKAFPEFLTNSSTDSSSISEQPSDSAVVSQTL